MELINMASDHRPAAHPCPRMCDTGGGSPGTVAGTHLCLCCLLRYRPLLEPGFYLRGHQRKPLLVCSPLGLWCAESLFFLPVFSPILLRKTARRWGPVPTLLQVTSSKRTHKLTVAEPVKTSGCHSCSML